MKRPLLQDDAFLADVARATTEEPDSLHLWWLGQSGFLVRWRKRGLLLDPYLSDSLTRKYADTDKPHVRMTERVIDPARLENIGLITSSHNHTDHLDAETLGPVMENNPSAILVAPRANREFVLERLRIDPVRLVVLKAGENHRSADPAVTVSAVPAAHETLEQDEAGQYRFLGYVVRIGHWNLYHSGDTVLYDGMAERLRPFNIDVALLPINGRSPERRVAGNLSGKEAARLAHDIGAKLVVPCHYDMFAFNTASPDAFVADCQRLGQPCRVLQNGERLRLAPKPETTG